MIIVSKQNEIRFLNVGSWDESGNHHVIPNTKFLDVVSDALAKSNVEGLESVEHGKGDLGYLDKSEYKEAINDQGRDQSDAQADSPGRSNVQGTVRRLYDALTSLRVKYATEKHWGDPGREAERKLDLTDCEAVRMNATRPFSSPQACMFISKSSSSKVALPLDFDVAFDFNFLGSISWTFLVESRAWARQPLRAIR